MFLATTIFFPDNHFIPATIIFPMKNSNKRNKFRKSKTHNTKQKSNQKQIYLENVKPKPNYEIEMIDMIVVDIRLILEIDRSKSKEFESHLA